VHDPYAPAIVETSYAVPREKTLAAPNHPERKAAVTFLCGSVDGVGKAARAWIELMNDGVFDVVLHHRLVNPTLHPLPAGGEPTLSRMLEHVRN